MEIGKSQIVILAYVGKLMLLGTNGNEVNLVKDKFRPLFQMVNLEETSYEDVLKAERTRNVISLH